MRRSGTSRSACSFFLAVMTAALLTTGAATALAVEPSATPAAERPAKSTHAALPSAQETSDGDMLDSVERVRRIMQQAIAAEVHKALEEARERMAADPDRVTQALARTQEHVRIAPELETAQRDQLLSQIAAVSHNASRLSSTRAERDDYRREVLAEQHARRELDSERLATQQATADRLAHVNSLASRGKFRDAEGAAQQIAGKNPDTVAGAAAAVESRMRANIADIQSLSERRRQKLYEELRTEDVQQAADSDDPPVKYPAATKWQELSERRKKWGEMASTYRPTPGEEKIKKALLETTSIDFQNVPLADAIDYLKTKHGIEIQLDNKGLTDAAVGPSAPVTRSAKGIRLRSALRLLLDDVGLTFVVRDDVLLITSKESADEMTTTRVYDVTDLVVPIPDPYRNGRSGTGRLRNRLPGRIRF